MRTSAKKTAEFFKEKGVGHIDTTLTFGEREIHYVQTGNERLPTLVFVHGSPGSWSAFKAYLADSTLLQHFRIIAPDRPGFGHSNFRKSMDLKGQAQLLNELLAKLNNGQPYTLIGHSYGGPAIAQMAALAPEQYDNLVILAGSVDPEAEKPEKWRRPLTRIPLKYLVPGALKPSNDEIWWLKEDLYHLKPLLKNLTQNILIIHGTADRLVPYRNVAYMQQELVSAKSLKLISLENERHFIVWDREKLIKDSLMTWLSEKK